MPTTSPNETQLLQHALETGLQVQKKGSGVKTKQLSISISNGFGIERKEHKKSIHYKITNQRDKKFKFILDHEEIYSNPKYSANLFEDQKTSPLVFEEIPKGIRVQFEIDEKAECTVEVNETHIKQTKVELTNTNEKQKLFHNIEWIEENTSLEKSPLLHSKEVQACIAQQKILQELDAKIDSANAEVKILDKRQKRLRENIKVGGQDRITESWRNDLAKTEIELLKIEQDLIPNLLEEREEKEEELRKAIIGISDAWNIEE